MKIYICTDLEGATGVFKFKQTREKGPEFYDAMKLLMGDIEAVCEGLKEAGVDEIYVLDGHNGGNNFIPEYMVPGIKYITGYPRPGILYGLDETFDGIILLGFHAKHGTPDGVLNHTQSSLTEAKYFYDGIERGEIFQIAVIAGHYNVPVILVTGDVATCREAKELLGEDLPTVAVKKGISREAAILLSPRETKILLKQGAKKAIEMLPKLKPYKVKFPIKLVIRKIGPEETKPENPYYSEKEFIVENALDIITGTQK
ncbi:MAG: M55 family metallopeptidase [Candidatus Omnitrophica bacterium]|nr:M55 family metallopeptidase [Candidatus Omnitrophota bacterium]MCM8806463.1 M55 family metallopeptidase [Candidatus Omnitrophota bacterium]